MKTDTCRLICHVTPLLSIGMGKSLCFEALTVTGNALNPECNDATFGKDIVLVISPLKFLMDMQRDRLQGLGLPSVCLGSRDNVQDIQQGKFR
jgi:superfamily II DNA helicase RecQ